MELKSTTQEYCPGRQQLNDNPERDLALRRVCQFHYVSTHGNQFDVPRNTDHLPEVNKGRLDKLPSSSAALCCAPPSQVPLRLHEPTIPSQLWMLLHSGRHARDSDGLPNHPPDQRGRPSISLLELTGQKQPAGPGQGHICSQQVDFLHKPQFGAIKLKGNHEAMDQDKEKEKVIKPQRTAKLKSVPHQSSHVCKQVEVTHPMMPCCLCHSAQKAARHTCIPQGPLDSSQEGLPFITVSSTTPLTTTCQLYLPA